MNIGIVCYPTYGGSGVVATELGKVLAEREHTIHFITYSEPQRLEKFNANIYYHEVSPASYPLFRHLPYESALSSQIVSVAKNSNLDVVHAHYAVPHASASIMASQILETMGLRLPVVTTLHGTDITLVGKESSYAPVVTFSINKSDAVTTVSESLRTDTLDQFNIKRDIEVVPNFVDFERFKRSNRIHFKKAICPQDEKLIVHVSNFRKVKRVEDVVAVFKGIRNVVPAKLLLVGDGPERTRIEQKCREMGTCEDIRFLGKLEAVDEVLSIADLFIMPSEKESFGLAALEAMACKVPVIASNTGGLPELVTADSGLLSDVGDVERMTQNALHILDEKNHGRFEEGAFSRSQAFRPENIVPMYESIYEKVVQADFKHMEHG